MSWVLVIDTEHCPLDPVHPGQVRRLLARGQAAVWRRAPFTLILQRAAPDTPPQPLRLTLDPGSRTTRLSLVTETEAGTGTETTRTAAPEGEGERASVSAGR